MSEKIVPLKLGVTGSRVGLSKIQYVQLKAWLEKPMWGRNFEIVEFRHGDCIGVDVQVAYMIEKFHPETKIIGHIPKNDSLRGFFESHEETKPKGYLARNRDIVNNSDMLIAFPKDRNKNRGGTWYTIKYAQKQGKKVGIFHFDGQREMFK